MRPCRCPVPFPRPARARRDRRCRRPPERDGGERCRCRWLSGVRVRRHWARTPHPHRRGHALLRDPRARALGQAGLALPGAGVPEDDVLRGARLPVGQAQRQGGLLGHGCAPARRHVSLGPGSAPRGGLAHSWTPSLPKRRAGSRRRNGSPGWMPSGLTSTWSPTGPPGPGWSQASWTTPVAPREAPAEAGGPRRRAFRAGLPQLAHRPG